MKILGQEFIVYYDFAIYKLRLEFTNLDINYAFEYNSNKLIDVYDTDGNLVDYQISSIDEVIVRKKNKTYVGTLVEKLEDRITLYVDSNDRVKEEIMNPDSIISKKSEICYVNKPGVFIVSFRYEKTDWIPSLKFNIDNSTLSLKATLNYNDVTKLKPNVIKLVSVTSSAYIDHHDKYENVRLASPKISSLRTSGSDTDTDNLGYDIIEYNLNEINGVDGTEDKRLELNSGTEYSILIEKEEINPTSYYNLDIDTKFVQLVYKIIAPFDIPSGSNVQLISNGVDVITYELRKKYTKGSEMNIKLPSDGMLIFNVTKLYDKKANLYIYQIIVSNNDDAEKYYNLQIPLTYSIKNIVLKINDVDIKIVTQAEVKDKISTNEVVIIYDNQYANIKLPISTDTKKELITLNITYDSTSS
jgi:hypothetical protein